MNSEDQLSDNLNDILSFQEIKTQDLFDLNYVSSNSNLNSKLFIAHFNIRGLNANFERLESFLASLKHKPQIIICTETRILEFANFFNLDGYTAYYNESKINICDGVIVFVLDSIDHTSAINIIEPMKN